MPRYMKLSIATFLMLACLVPAASAYPRVFVRGAFVGPAFYGPTWYGPGWVEPYGVVRVPVTGTVKFETKMKDPSVFVDGGYAGALEKLKSFPLQPGPHTVELRDRDDRTFFLQRINVIAGKTIKLTPPR